jgi:membrane fusion protein (multidrug efflux system)
MSLKSPLSFRIFPLLGFLFFAGCDETSPTGQKDQSQSPATLVEVYIARAADNNRKIQATGNIQANESTRLSAEESGIVKAIHFKEGSQVEKGELLLELENADVSAELQEAQASRDLAEQNYQRSQKLYEAKGISKAELDRMETTFRQADAQYQKLMADLNKGKIYAPFSGTIGLRNISKGDYLAANSSFATLVDVTPLKIDFSIPEKYLNTLQTGDSITFTTASGSSQHRAEIFAIEPQIDPATRTVKAKAVFTNEDKRLLPGGFANILYEVEAFNDELVVPNQAIVPEVDGKKIYLVKNGKVVTSQVTTGIRMADYIQVVSGLSEGDTVVTAGLLQIREGIPVRVSVDRSFTVRQGDLP